MCRPTTLLNNSKQIIMKPVFRIAILHLISFNRFLQSSDKTKMMNTFIITLLSILFWQFSYAQNKASKPTFNHIAIYTTDLKKSGTFYRDVIGLDTIANPFKDNKHVWFAIGNGTELHIIAGTDSVLKHPQDNHLCFSVSSVEAFVKALNKLGIPYVNARGVTNAITVRPDGVKQIYFNDPDGYWIEINDAKNRE